MVASEEPSLLGAGRHLPLDEVLCRVTILKVIRHYSGS